MRPASFVALAAVFCLLTAAIPAEAQTYYTQNTIKKRTQIIVKKRSYLDAGTTVKPGSMHYHDYAFGPAMSFSTNGPFSESSFPGTQRWPMLRWWEGGRY